MASPGNSWVLSDGEIEHGDGEITI